MSVFLHLDPENLPHSLVWNPSLSDDAFEALCTDVDNDIFHFERTKEGVVRLKPPVGMLTSTVNSELTYQIGNWGCSQPRALCVGSGCGFFLPDGSMLSPSAAFVSAQKLQSLTKAQRAGFLRLCPEFIIELLSKPELLEEMKDKMKLWLANGVALGWLIDPYAHRVFVYEPGARVRIVSGSSVEGQGPAEGFTLNLSKLWRSYER